MNRDDAGVAAAAARAPGGEADAWAQIRADPQIQYTPVTIPEAEPPPRWLEALLEWLGDVFGPLAATIVGNWHIIWPLLAAVGALIAALALLRIFAPVWRRGKRSAADEEPDWMPDAAAATALIGDADRLAQEGRYEEATRLLLTRSVAQIAQARPGLVEPSSTAREIVALPFLPPAAAHAFGAIAGLVERSLFALGRLSLDDWRTARAAYADFALAAESEQAR